jgi:hypothetical protein
VVAGVTLTQRGDRREDAVAGGERALGFGP